MVWSGTTTTGQGPGTRPTPRRCRPPTSPGRRPRGAHRRVRRAARRGRGLRREVPEAGVAVYAPASPGQIHGFFTMLNVPGQRTGDRGRHVPRRRPPAPTAPEGANHDRRPRKHPPVRHVGTVDAVIVGAGFAGLYMLHRLRELGLHGRVFEAGDGVGGTWYWNRYPGARCDVESIDYSYSFSPELEQEWEWSERYADPARDPALRQPRRRPLRPAARHPVRHAGRARPRSTSGAQRWTRRRPTAATTCRRRYLVMAVGCLSASKLPEIPGLDDVPGRLVPHRPLAPRGRRLHRPARRRDRHRVVGDPVDPDHRRAGRRRSPCSSARRTSRCRPATGRSTDEERRRA